MRDDIRDLKDLESELQAIEPQRGEVTDMLHQTWMFEGFSMEWVLDRFEATGRQ